MKLIKCEKGHFYNADKLESCPYCANQKVAAAIEDVTGSNQSCIETYIPDKQTLEKYKDLSNRQIAGWLVCIHGNMQGDSFTLYCGDNFIGRDTSMDVTLFEEPTVSRYKHALITYHINRGRFTLSTNPKTESIVLYNNHPLGKNKTVVLSAHDRITLGECTLCFVPFCGERFQWEDLD